MLSQEQNASISSDEDDDYNLPSLSERIKALQSQNIQKEVSSTKTEESKISKNEEKNNSPPLNIKLDFSLTSESEDEESQFLSFSQRIQSTPQIKHLENGYIINESESDDEMFSNLTERLNMMTPRTENKENCYVMSESDSDDEMFSNLAERLNFMTPRTENKENYCVKNESDSDDEIFSNLEERMLNMMTPRTENKENYDTAAGSDVKKMNEFRSPFPPEKKVSCKVLDSESDESFSNFIEILRTPISIKKVSYKVLDSESDESFSNFVETLRTPISLKKISQKKVDSESDESFSNIVEKLRTPVTINRKIQNKVNESDSDDSFLNSTRKQAFQTPKSQKKRQDADSLLKITELKCLSTLAIKDTPNTRNKLTSKIENEFNALFLSKSIHEKFLQKRESYAHKLYEFYNKKVFNLQLPPDMPLIYTGALKTTAGLTCCSAKNGIYSCLIKLSSTLMISFDRLKETLLHEMCHAAVWIINKRHRDNHGPLWQIWASRCKLILPFIQCPARCHDYEITYNVWYQCPNCQWKKGKCKQVRKYHGALCKRCKTPIIVTYT